MLKIHEVAMELLADVHGEIEKISRRDREMAVQLRKSLPSIVANIAEGCDQIGKRRTYHYAIALGSARESWTMLRCAAAFKYIEPPRAYEARFDHVIGTLMKVLRPK